MVTFGVGLRLSVVWTVGGCFMAYDLHGAHRPEFVYLDFPLTLALTAAILLVGRTARRG